MTQFLLRALCRRSSLVIALAAAISVGSGIPPSRCRAWLRKRRCDPVVALAGKLAPLFCIFFLIMWPSRSFWRALQIPFKETCR